MKKISKICCVILCVVLLLSVTACNKNSGEKPFEPTDGISLWNKINETMENLVSYESEGTSTIVYYYSGNKFECTSVFKLVDDDKEGDEYFYLYDKTDVKCAEQSYEESRANLS